VCGARGIYYKGTKVEWHNARIKRGLVYRDNTNPPSTKSTCRYGIIDYKAFCRSFLFNDIWQSLIIVLILGWSSAFKIDFVRIIPQFLISFFLFSYIAGLNIIEDQSVDKEKDPLLDKLSKFIIKHKSGLIKLKVNDEQEKYMNYVIKKIDEWYKIENTKYGNPKIGQFLSKMNNNFFYESLGLEKDNPLVEEVRNIVLDMIASYVDSKGISDHIKVVLENSFRDMDLKLIGIVNFMYNHDNCNEIRKKEELLKELRSKIDTSKSQKKKDAKAVMVTPDGVIQKLEEVVCELSQ